MREKVPSFRQKVWFNPPWSSALHEMIWIREELPNFVLKSMAKNRQ